MDYQLILHFLFSVGAGSAYAALFIITKKATMETPNFFLDLLFFLMRMSILAAIFYLFFKIIVTNSGLLALSFVLSYLSTVGIIAYK